jgi:hypothetical protein
MPFDTKAFTRLSTPKKAGILAVAGIGGYELYKWWKNRQANAASTAATTAATATTPAATDTGSVGTSGGFSGGGGGGGNGQGPLGQILSAIQALQPATGTANTAGVAGLSQASLDAQNQNATSAGTGTQPISAANPPNSQLTTGPNASGGYPISSQTAAPTAFPFTTIFTSGGQTYYGVGNTAAQTAAQKAGYTIVTAKAAGVPGGGTTAHYATKG